MESSYFVNIYVWLYSISWRRFTDRIISHRLWSTRERELFPTNHEKFSHVLRSNLSLPIQDVGNIFSTFKNAIKTMHNMSAYPYQPVCPLYPPPPPQFYGLQHTKFRIFPSCVKAYFNKLFWHIVYISFTSTTPPWLLMECQFVVVSRLTGCPKKKNLTFSWSL